jgi:hypothetical protein
LSIVFKFIFKFKNKFKVKVMSVTAGAGPFFFTSAVRSVGIGSQYQIQPGKVFDPPPLSTIIAGTPPFGSPPIFSIFFFSNPNFRVTANFATGDVVWNTPNPGIGVDINIQERTIIFQFPNKCTPIEAGDMVTFVFQKGDTYMFRFTISFTEVIALAVRSIKSDIGECD